MQFYLLGHLRVANGSRSEISLRPTAARLLAFLLLHRHDVHHREVVAELIWQETGISRARKNLSTTLWQLRNALGCGNGVHHDFFTTTPEQIQINQATDLWLDVALFEDRANQGLSQTADNPSQQAVEALQDAVQFYSGELLSGFYDSWILNERDRLRLLYLRCLTFLMDHHQRQNEPDLAIDYAQRILSVEPWREDVHRRLMYLYTEDGRRTCAIEQYKICRQILAEELDTLPLEQTENLYQQLLAGASVEYSRSTPAGAEQQVSKTSTHALTPSATPQDLQGAIQMLKDAQTMLNQALQLVDQLTQETELRKRI
ncbi:bacterial transcriptional activator domain-containing protein [Chloroflexi bacterium TSY]|nr:bacterial transcriptional activator domain-containing protein [Chloroflexi bacterium TSY]